MRILLLTIAATTLVSLAPAQKINDSLQRTDGARMRGLEITEFLLTGVRGKRGGKDPFEVPASLVVDVEWSTPPEQFVAGKAALERGDFATAVQLLGDVKTDRPLIKADAEFFQLKAAVGAAGVDKAAAATAAERAKQWLAANVNHFRTPEAMLLAGRAERLAGTGGAAAATLRELDERAIRESFGVVWSARAKFELAMTLLADGKAGEARSAFTSAVSAAESALAKPSAADAELKAIKTQAKVGEGETYLLDKDYQRAEAFFRELSTGSDPQLVAVGYAGEGEAQFWMAVASKKPEDFRRAQMTLARASVFDTQADDASAKANYYLGRCLLELGTERESDSFRQRAHNYFQIVVTSYPTSRFAAQAKQDLAR